MKIKQIIDALPALKKLSDQDLRIKTLYYVSNLICELNDVLKSYDVAKNRLIDKYFVAEDEKLIIKDGCENNFEKELNELLDMEIESDIKPVEIGEEENIKLSCYDLHLLDGIIKIKLGQ